MQRTLAELNGDQIGGEWVKQILQFCTRLKPCIQLLQRAFVGVLDHGCTLNAHSGSVLIALISGWRL